MFAVFSFVGAKMQSLARVFASRVANDGGTTESLNCINPSYLLSQSSFLQIPSGVKATVAYSELPTNGNGNLTWSRNSVANRTLANGTVESVAANVPRLSYMYGSCPALLLEPQRTNSLRNSTMQGASTSPSTLPTSWVATGGLTQTVVGIGTENGLPYIDIRFNGIATQTTAIATFESSTQITASNGQSWTSSFWVKEVSASAPPNSYRNAITERDSVGATLAGSTQTFTISSTLTRNIFTRTNTNASTARITNAFSAALTVASSYDFTVRIAAPQMELGAFATTWINTTNAAATRLVDTFTRNNIYTNGLISASGGTWYVELRGNLGYTRDAGVVSLYIGDASSSPTNTFEIRNGGGTNVTLSIGKRISNTFTTLFLTTTSTVKIAIKWNGSTADLFVNGVKQVTATAFTITNMDFLIGNANDVPKFIQAMALYPTPLSDSDCTLITT